MILFKTDTLVVHLSATLLTFDRPTKGR